MLNIFARGVAFLSARSGANRHRATSAVVHLIKDPATISCPASRACSCYDAAFALFSPEGKMGSSKKGC